MRSYRTGLVLAACVALAVPASAQSLSDLGALTGRGGASGLLGGVLPNVGATSAGNAAGVLSYCVRNRILGGGDATSALNGLLSRKDVGGSKGFAAGQSGQLVTGRGSAVSLDALKGKIKAKVCDLVLQHARSML